MTSGNVPPRSASHGPDFEREMEIAREIMVRRRGALRQLALGVAIRDEDHDLHGKSLKS